MTPEVSSLAHGPAASRQAERRRRRLPAPGGRRDAHAHRRDRALRRAGAAVRGRARAHPQPAAPRAALPPEARGAAAAASAASAGSTTRASTSSTTSATPRCRAPATSERLLRLAGADLLPAPGSHEAAVGDVDGRGPRGRPLGADLQDAPRARRRRRRRRPDDDAVRPRARRAAPQRPTRSGCRSRSPAAPSWPRPRSTSAARRTLGLPLRAASLARRARRSAGSPRSPAPSLSLGARHAAERRDLAAPADRDRAAPSSTTSSSSRTTSAARSTTSSSRSSPARCATGCTAAACAPRGSR